MLATLLATLLLPLGFAVLTGILMSLAHYLLKTSTPRVRPVLPNDAFTHFAHQPAKPSCPQLGIIEILGDLYFGAAHHVEESIRENQERNPTQRFLLLRMHSVENCDISGIHTLESIWRTYRDRGGSLYFTRVRKPVLEVMRTAGFYAQLGAGHFRTEDDVVSYLFYHVLDPAVCIYECPVRAFRECQDLPKSLSAVEHHFPPALAPDDVRYTSAQALWQTLHGATAPAVVDVREPREFREGHIPAATNVPLPELLAGHAELPHEGPLVLVCRSGRRSTRAAGWLRTQGYADIAVLQGGMLAWEAAGLLEALGDDG
jgi:SulP family sulfate permease